MAAPSKIALHALLEELLNDSNLFLNCLLFQLILNCLLNLKVLMFIKPRLVKGRDHMSPSLDPPLTQFMDPIYLNCLLTVYETNKNFK